MTKRCLDEGLLQAYMDGELSNERAAGTAAHVASCDACAAALADFENENAFFAAAFAPDESVGVPTEVLRSRVGAAVAQLEDALGSNRRSNGWNFNGFLASLSSLFTFTPQRAAAFASVLAVVAAGAIYFAVIKQKNVTGVRQPSNEVAKTGTAPEAPRTVITPTPEVTDSDGNGVVVSAPTVESGGVRVLKARHTTGRTLRKNLPETTTPEAGGPELANKTKELLPGEKDYKTAIASLEKTINMGGDASLKPSLRVQYERNVAILDTAIEQTRKVAAANPKDKDAVGFLMSAYQSKVELLTKVADQAQVAALGR